jgi:hypothetical protein
MFCTNCGIVIAEKAQFCQGCGSKVSTNPVADNDPTSIVAKISASEILEQSLELESVFATETWVLNLMKKKWPKSNPNDYNRKVIGRLKGKFAALNGSDLEVIFTNEYLALVSKGSPMGWPIPSMVVVLTLEEVKLIQVGSANYLHGSTTTMEGADWWTISIILKNEREMPIIFIPLGNTNYQHQKNFELYSAKISIIANFWPITFDGGHIELGGGQTTGFSLGFWTSVD